jgi:hypothetical protein
MSERTPSELPEHIRDSGEWRRWPRKVEAHLAYAVRERQITAYVRNGKLKAYACPDDTVRMDPDALAQHFGEPGEFQGRDRDLPKDERERRRHAAKADAELTADPMAAICRETMGMMREQHAQSIGLIKVITDPLNALLQAYKDKDASQRSRITELEGRLNEADALRAELADAAHERSLAVKRQEASERRRDETLKLLKDQVPELVGLYLSGASLSGWAKKVPRDALEALLESDAISEAVRDELRRAAGIQSKPADAAPGPTAAPETPNQSMNGASAHGHS